MGRTGALTFQGLLRKLVLETEGETVSVRQLLDVVGRRSYGPVILLLGFVAISPLTFVPGANWLMASVTLIFAIQIVFGRPYPWLPKKALDASFPRQYLIQTATAGMKWARFVDRLTRPRLAFLTEPPFVQVVALVCVAAALVTYPSGMIPLGPFLPSLAILLIGIGLAARDGVFLLVACGVLAGAVMLLTRLLGSMSGWLSGG